MEPETFPETNTPAATQPEPAAETTESFSDLLSQFESAHKKEEGARQVEATVVSIAADAVFLDIGFKTEGMLPRSAFRNNADEVKPGDKFLVSPKGRNAEGFYDLSLTRVAQPTDWASLQQAFTERTAIVGTVAAVVKGGLSVDVGVRAFMPASRSGVREAAEMEKLVGQEITCRIIKLDTAEEDVVVDRRAVLEEQALSAQQDRYAALQPGEVVTGTVRSLTNYGAFIDIGGIDGLLHVSDLSWSRVSTPEEVLSVGQELQVKVLKIDADTRRISLGLKQLQPEPWETAADRYQAGQRVTGTVRRLMDFGAFVELEPGIEGMIHVSEMSWVKRVRKPSDLLKEGDTVEVVILSISPAEKRMALGLKQTLGDPWADVAQRFPVGSAVEGTVTRMVAFGAFVQLTEGIEGLVHISEITADRRLNHPQEALKLRETVHVQVLAIDAEKRQIRLSMKQLVPTGLDEYLSEHKAGDAVSGRIVEVNGSDATVEVGEGIRAACRLPESVAAPAAEASSESRADLSALTSLLQSRWKGTAKAAAPAAEPVRAGQVRSFRIVSIDPEQKRIELKLA